MNENVGKKVQDRALMQANRVDVDEINTTGLIAHTHEATKNVVQSITFTTTTINYLDHSSNPQSQSVVTGITITYSNVVDATGDIA